MNLNVDHLVQTQVLSRQEIPVNSLFSKRFSTPSDFRRATVVDFVAVRSARINADQQTVENQGLKTEGLPTGFQVENLVPNQILLPVEIC
jgi:hypothetical protein